MRSQPQAAGGVGAQGEYGAMLGIGSAMPGWAPSTLGELPPVPAAPQQWGAPPHAGHGHGGGEAVRGGLSSAINGGRFAHADEPKPAPSEPPLIFGGGPGGGGMGGLGAFDLVDPSGASIGIDVLALADDPLVGADTLLEPAPRVEDGAASTEAVSTFCHKCGCRLKRVNAVFCHMCGEKQ